jgi:hypothetical protein
MVLEKIFVRKNDMVTKGRSYIMRIFVFVLFSDSVIKPRNVERKVLAFIEDNKI